MNGDLNNSITLRITDDSGFIAIVNTDKYVSFVHEDWEFPQLTNHFIHEMNKENLIVWKTGLEGEWTIAFLNSPSSEKSFREFSKTIVVTSEQLFLTNYEDLTSAAQFADIKIPNVHNADLVIKLENGKYKFTIRQMFDPGDYDFDPEGKINFEITIKNETESTGEIEKIFWSKE